ncbi:SDR family oxidoreductase [Candidatus Sumerlaeota bacterium]|nr:SDR family oxidoreductase [Candidatus Sumerlaeota bacterium]
MVDERQILLTGATGYIGGRLLSRLEDAGHRLRCIARHPEHIRLRPESEITAVKGDVLDLDSLREAMRGVSCAFYLVHSLGSRGDFGCEERRGAENFARAASEAGVERIIYLGGLGKGDSLSKHLSSRQEVGRTLRRSGVPTIEFQSSIIIGSGSLSFEMIRALVQRLPVMITPRWVRTKTQPIAIEDILDYLIAAVDVPLSESRVFEIGGEDQVSYGDLMREYARQRGLRRLMIPVPVLSPWLSSLWLGLVTPIFARIGRKLVDSLRNETVVVDQSALEVFPIRPRGHREAITRAMENEDREFAETRWSGALSSGGETRGWGGVRFGTRLVDSRVRETSLPLDRVFTPIRRIGGSTGWYFGNWLWRLRGALDLLVGGVGMRRGRPDPEWLNPGDPLDFWRVEAFEPNRLLRLRAEMRLPGRAWLQFEVEPTTQGSRLRQTAIFDPVGLMGLAYWFALWPLHALIFRGMLRNIVRAAERERIDSGRMESDLGGARR